MEIAFLQLVHYLLYKSKVSKERLKFMIDEIRHEDFPVNGN